ncbi:MAG: hypothetical protein J2P46_03750 [Zavarzinella sp.]|nr:hypothetical protein [Zavarzinella sp.]
MLRHALVGLVVLALGAGAALAQGKGKDHEVKGSLVKVDVTKKTLTIKTADGEKTYEVNDETKFVGPKGGTADEGIKDERLVPGVMLTLKIAANNRTAHEVHIPERKGKK